jgi:8-oxo-dGTP diphosphatase
MRRTDNRDVALPESGSAAADPGAFTARLEADEAPVDLRCSVVVLDRDRVLLLHRSSRPYDLQHGDWVLPGGRPRASEGMAACARRETLEETGLDVVVRHCLFVVEVTTAAPENRRAVELIFEAVGPAGMDPITREADRHAQFVSLNLIHRLNLRPPIAGHLRGLARRNRISGAAYLGNLWRPGQLSATEVANERTG